MGIIALVRRYTGWPIGGADANRYGVITRRTAISALSALLTAGLVVAAPSQALAAAKRKLIKVERGKRGVTLSLRLTHAPFPAAGAPYQDATVMVFVPHHFRLPKRRSVDAVVHFHGHFNTARSAMQRHQLREQLYDSKQNAILVVPQAALNAADSSGGKLERRGGLRRMLTELIGVLGSRPVSRALGKARLAGARGIGMLCLSAHSGGYRVAAACLRRGGINVNEVYLFDALYGGVPVFRKWVMARKGKKGRRRHKLISHYGGGKVRENNIKLMAQLKRAGVSVSHETKPGQLSRAVLTKTSAGFIATPLAHGKLTFRHNNLRDCLFASGLRRRLSSDWFDDKNAPRSIDTREP